VSVSVPKKQLPNQKTWQHADTGDGAGEQGIGESGDQAEGGRGWRETLEPRCCVGNTTEPTVPSLSLRALQNILRSLAAHANERLQWHELGGKSFLSGQGGGIFRGFVLVQRNLGNLYFLKAFKLFARQTKEAH